MGIAIIKGKPKFYLECPRCGKPAIYMREELKKGEPLKMSNFVYDRGIEPVPNVLAMCQHCDWPIKFTEQYKRKNS